MTKQIYKYAALAYILIPPVFASTVLNTVKKGAESIGFNFETKKQAQRNRRRNKLLFWGTITGISGAAILIFFLKKEESSEEILYKRSVLLQLKEMKDPPNVMPILREDIDNVIKKKINRKKRKKISDPKRLKIIDKNIAIRFKNNTRIKLNFMLENVEKKKYGISDAAKILKKIKTDWRNKGYDDNELNFLAKEEYAEILDNLILETENYDTSSSEDNNEDNNTDTIKKDEEDLLYMHDQIGKLQPIITLKDEDQEQYASSYSDDISDSDYSDDTSGSDYNYGGGTSDSTSLNNDKHKSPKPLSNQELDIIKRAVTKGTSAYYDE